MTSAIILVLLAGALAALMWWKPLHNFVYPARDWPRNDLGTLPLVWFGLIIGLLLLAAL